MNPVLPRPTLELYHKGSPTANNVLVVATHSRSSPCHSHQRVSFYRCYFQVFLPYVYRPAAPRDAYTASPNNTGPQQTTQPRASPSQPSAPPSQPSAPHSQPSAPPSQPSNPPSSSSPADSGSDCVVQ